jgi:hypothetical protein
MRVYTGLVDSLHFELDVGVDFTHQSIVATKELVGDLVRYHMRGKENVLLFYLMICNAIQFLLA